MKSSSRGIGLGFRKGSRAAKAALAVGSTGCADCKRIEGVIFMESGRRKSSGSVRAGCAVLCASAALLCASLSSSYAQDQAPLRIGVDGTYAPHAFPALDGGLQGFNVDLVKAIAKKMNREFEFGNAAFSGLIPALNAGRYDFLSVILAANPRTAENLLFTEGYLQANDMFVMKKGAEPINGVEDLKGKILTTNKGNRYEEWLRDNADKYGFKMLAFDNQPNAIQAVVDGRADAALSGSTVLRYAMKLNPNLVEAFILDNSKITYGLPFALGSEPLRNEVERALECLKIDGTVAKITEEWFGVTPAEGDVAVTPDPGYGMPGLQRYDAQPHEFNCG